MQVTLKSCPLSFSWVSVPLPTSASGKVSRLQGNAPLGLFQSAISHQDHIGFHKLLPPAWVSPPNVEEAVASTGFHNRAGVPTLPCSGVGESTAREGAGAGGGGESWPSRGSPPPGGQGTPSHKVRHVSLFYSWKGPEKTSPAGRLWPGDMLIVIFCG